MLPRFIQTLIEQNKIEQALDWIETDHERVALFAYNGQRERAEQEAMALLDEQSVEEVIVEYDMVVVYTERFTGYHPIVEDTNTGEKDVSMVGEYEHNEIDVRFQSTPPNPEYVEECVRTVQQQEPLETAAKAAYRRSRM